ncbi:hypothetical protein [Lysobacter solisilvae (ex Woo and Kim 2020)]|uniref:Transmembrane protein n=1 Tax=Agrilutibacter terrestris TaxID=2865112 RepID=A0A7H0FUE8_9GAMM|nr:hypothetical protein [Lysobacter terrestris]QNP39664.1 hypothetical protein H8B22_09020 [Lysobacter terrestris]
MRHTDTAVHDEFQPRLEAALRYVLAIGLTLVVLLPGARGFSATLGWLPLWLLVMPAVAWWALRGFPLPGRAAPNRAAERRARRSGPQARRWIRSTPRRALPRAA